MKHKMCGIMDFFQSIRVVQKMIGELELKVMGNSIPEFWREASCKCVTLLSGQYAVLHDKEHCNGHKFPMIFS